MYVGKVLDCHCLRWIALPCYIRVQPILRGSEQLQDSTVVICGRMPINI